MKLRHLVPFAILMAWQAAPARVDSVPRSRFSFALAYGQARLEDYTPPQFDCEGNQTSPDRSEVVDVSSVGVKAELVTSGGLRLTAFGGTKTSARPELDGGYGGFQVAWESRWAGLGAGLTTGVPTGIRPVTGPQPNLYLRLGGGNEHFRFEWLPPGEASGIGGYVRAGVGFNKSPSGNTNGFAGLSLSPYGSVMAFLDTAVPLNGGLDLLLRGQFGPGHKNPPWGLALGVRFNASQ
jgi:hypothetical protein